VEASQKIVTPYTVAKERLERDNPRSWIWEEDGTELAGYYWDSDVWTQKDGTETEVRLVKHSTGYRALWLFESPQDLRGVFAEFDEQGLAEGDYIIVKRGARREFTADNGERRKFVPFSGVRVPAAELAELPEPEHARIVSRPDDSDAATEAALQDERDERDEALSGVHRPLWADDES
jgi:hypothetical protein